MNTLTPRCQFPFQAARRRRHHDRRGLVVEVLEVRTLLSTTTSVAIVASNFALLYSQAETLTATVSVPSNSAVPAPSEGTVTFLDGNSTLGTATVSGGVADFTTSALSLGTHDITVSYSGTANYAASNWVGTQTLVPASGLTLPGNVAVDGLGDVFITDSINNDVIEVTPAGTQSTVASGLAQPLGVAVDAAGDVFVADSFNSRVVKITANGTQTTVGSGLSFPESLAADAAGDVFIADSGNNRVVEVTSQGKQLTIGAGLANPEGVAVDAAGDVFIADFGNSRIVEVPNMGSQKTVVFGISSPHSVAVDSMGNLYIADGQVVKVTPSGTQTTIGSNVRFANSVAVDVGGDAFISDSGNDQVIEVTSGLHVSVSQSPTSTSIAPSMASTVFGQSETFTAAISVPTGATAPGAGIVTFFDGTTMLGTSSVTAGVAHLTTSALGLGAHAISASYGGTVGYAASTSGIEPNGDQAAVPLSGLAAPAFVTVDNMGDVFISDYTNNRVVKLTPGGIQTNVGSGLNAPLGVAVDSAGDLFIADARNQRVVEVAVNGTQTTVASGLTFPESVAVDGAGDVFIADFGANEVMKVTSSGTQFVGGCCLSGPSGVAVDSAGDVFIVDSGNNQVLEVTPSGKLTTAASGLTSPLDVAVDATGDIFISDVVNKQVVKQTPLGTQSIVGSNLSGPVGLAFDGSGNLLVADTLGDQVLRLTPGFPLTVGPDPTSTSVAASLSSTLFGQSETFTATISVPSGSTAPSTGTVTFFDGTAMLGSSAVSGGMATFTTSALMVGTHTITASYSGSAGYIASMSSIEPISVQTVVSASGLKQPFGAAVDGAGDVFIADTKNNRVIEVTSSGTQIPIGSGLSSPTSVAVDKAGDVFIADGGNNRVVEVTSSGAQSVIASGLGFPEGVAVDSAGDVFIADTFNRRVLKVTSTTQMTVGPALTPSIVAVDGAGDVFITYVDQGEIIKVTPSGTQTTVFSGVGVLGGVAVDTSGDLFVADAGNGRVLELAPTGTQTNIATGLNLPEGLAVDGAGDVFIVDNGDNRVLKLTAGVPVTVSQATPVLTWTKPADIPFGTALGKTQLDAIASEPGTFTYTPAAGTILPMGQEESLSVTFTPTDTTDFSIVTASTTINVVTAPPTIIGEHALFQRKLKHGKPSGKPALVGYEIDFSEKLSASSANLPSNYQVDTISTKNVKKKKITNLQPLAGFTVSYNDAHQSVNLLFASPQSFKTGGRIIVLGGPLAGVTGLSGAFVSGDRTLAVSTGGQSIFPG